MKKIFFLLLLPGFILAQNFVKTYDLKFFPKSATSGHSEYYQNGDTVETDWISFDDCDTLNLFFYSTDSCSVNPSVVFKGKNQNISETLLQQSYYKNSSVYFGNFKFLPDSLVTDIIYYNGIPVSPYSHNIEIKIRLVFSDTGNPVARKETAKYYAFIVTSQY